MTATLLDFSQRPDLALHAEIIGDIASVAEPLGIAPLIVGAFARDLHLLYGHGIETLRQTEDLDFALAVPDWSAFDALQERLIGPRGSRPRRRQHIDCATGTACRSIWSRSAVSRLASERSPGHRVARS
jgi:predicted nucleotidyltransferase